jgi:hypothetical protein
MNELSRNMSIVVTKEDLKATTKNITLKMDGPELSKIMFSARVILLFTFIYHTHFTT